MALVGPFLISTGPIGSSNPIPTNGYRMVAFTSNVSVTDTVTVNANLPDGNAAVLAPDVNGVYTGLAVAAPTRWYNGGMDYVVTKVGTAAAATVYMYALVVSQ